MVKVYSSNLTLAQYELIAPLIPPAKPGGRPRKVSMWAVLNAIFYVVTQGCKWRDLLGDFPAWQTVYIYFRQWRDDETWVTIHARLRSWTRAAAGRFESPAEVILDSQSTPRPQWCMKRWVSMRLRPPKGANASPSSIPWGWS